jgi:hypothetical protein
MALDGTTQRRGGRWQAQLNLFALIHKLGDDHPNHPYPERGVNDRETRPSPPEMESVENSQYNHDSRSYSPMLYESVYAAKRLCYVKPSAGHHADHHKSPFRSR